MSTKKEDEAREKGAKDADWARRDINPVNELLGRHWDPPKGQEEAYREGWHEEKNSKK